MFSICACIVYLGIQKLNDERQCRFIDESKKCRRYSRVEIFSPGTAYEKQVNVGHCIGACNDTGQFKQTVHFMGIQSI